MKSGLPIDVHELLHRRSVESLRVEYKPAWNHVSGSQALNTICAFANDLLNVNGGYLLIGVDEQDGRPVLPVRGIAEEALDDVQKKLRGACNRIQPSYTPLIVPERIGEAWIIAVYCPGGDARPYEAPETLTQGAQRRPYVRTNSETREAKGDLLRQLQEVSDRVPFDDRACYEAETPDLSSALVHDHLHEARSRLAGERIDGDALYRKLHLLKRVNGHEVPRNVALLFFSAEPRRWFRGAKIEIAQLPAGRGGDEIIERNIEGPLPTMIRTALDYLKGLIPVEVRKVPGRAEATRIEAWPFAALEEALINAVHHRGYDVPDPIKVEILPDALRIVSYPGPVAGLALEDLESRDPPPVPARNKRIAELLKDLRLAEARGTGLAKIRQEMERNGSPPPRLRFDPDRTYFEVTLPIHPAFLRKAGPQAGQPLRLGSPAPPEEVVGREELVERVLRTLETQSVLLVGPPGRGASSALGAVVAEAERRGEQVLHLDVEGVTIFGFAAAVLEWWELRREAGAPRDELLVRLIERYDEQEQRAPLLLSELGKELAAAKVIAALDNLDRHSGRPPTEQQTPLDGLVMLMASAPRLKVLGTARTLDGVNATDYRTLPLPPLSRAATRELASRLLQGASLGDDQTALEQIVDASAGIPEVLVRLVEELRQMGSASPEDVTLATDAMAVDPAHPAGLSRRLKAFRDYTRRLLAPTGQPDATIALLDMATMPAAGRRRLDLIADAVSAGFGRLLVVEALRQLELDGWLVEVDGLIRFEHPHLRETWLLVHPLNVGDEVQI